MSFALQLLRLLSKRYVTLPMLTVLPLVGRLFDVNDMVAVDAVPGAKVRLFDPFVIFTDPLAAVPLVNVPVELAVAGGLASKVTPSTVSVELPLMVLELSVPTVPVLLAATPLSVVLQSFLIFLFTALIGSVTGSTPLLVENAPAPERARCWIM